jgi:hypothetical protein
MSAAVAVKSAVHPLLITGEGRGVLSIARTALKQWEQARQERGGMLTRTEAAKIAGVSHERIRQLIADGRLKLYRVEVDFPCGPMTYGEFVSGDELVRWMESPKTRGGRGKRRVPLPAPGDE